MDEENSSKEIVLESELSPESIVNAIKLVDPNVLIDDDLNKDICNVCNCLKGNLDKIVIRISDNFIKYDIPYDYEDILKLFKYNLINDEDFNNIIKERLLSVIRDNNNYNNKIRELILEIKDNQVKYKDYFY